MIYYDKLQYDITRNKDFMIMERPGPSKHLSTLKDSYRYVNKDFKYFVWITEDIPRTRLNIFREIFVDLCGFR